MVQHSGQQASELPTLLVHPRSVFLLVYPGGHCGEFLAWWLGQHSGCVRTPIRGINNNRYVWQPSYRFEYSEQGTQDRLFLTGHSSTMPSKVGFSVPDTAQHIRLYSNRKYLHFFYYLFLIKTIFFEYRVDEPKVPAFFDHKQWKNFLEYLGTRKSFYYHEAENWLNNRHVDIQDHIYERWSRLEKSDQPDAEPSVDIGRLFFENTEHHAQEFLSSLNIEFSPKLFRHLSEYHQRNVVLVEKYADTNINEFLNLSADQALEVMVSRHHQSFS